MSGPAQRRILSLEDAERAVNGLRVDVLDLRRWRVVNESAYNREPMNAYCISVTNTSSFVPGLPVRVVQTGPIETYAVIHEIVTNARVTIRGPGLQQDAPIIMLMLGRPEMVVVERMIRMNATPYNTVARRIMWHAVAHGQGYPHVWRRATGYCVHFAATHAVPDTAAQPYVNVILKSARRLSKANDSKGVQMLGTPNVPAESPAGSIDRNAYHIMYGEEFDVLVTDIAGCAKNAAHPMCEIVFVLP